MLLDSESGCWWADGSSDMINFQHTGSLTQLFTPCRPTPLFWIMPSQLTGAFTHSQPFHCQCDSEHQLIATSSTAFITPLDYYPRYTLTVNMVYISVHARPRSSAMMSIPTSPGPPTRHIPASGDQSDRKRYVQIPGVEAGCWSGHPQSSRRYGRTLSNLTCHCPSSSHHCFSYLL